MLVPGDRHADLGTRAEGPRRRGSDRRRHCRADRRPLHAHGPGAAPLRPHSHGLLPRCAGRDVRAGVVHERGVGALRRLGAHTHRRRVRGRVQRGRGVAVAQARSQAARRSAVHARGLDDAAGGVWDPVRAGIVAAAVALKLLPFPFLTFPLAFALWFLSLDLAALLIGSQGLVAFEQKQVITLLFGATVLGVTYLLDHRTDQDYAFWLYLFGLVAFWGALTYDGVGSVGYCLINLGLMLVAVLLQRKTFMVFGAIGVYSYLGHLAFHVFKNSLLFPAALTALGIAIIAAGVWYRSREAAVEAALLRVLPGALRRTLPRYRAA